MNIIDLTQAGDSSEYMPNEAALNRLSMLPMMESVYVFNTTVATKKMMSMEECHTLLMERWNAIPIYLVTTNQCGKEITLDTPDGTEDILLPRFDGTGCEYLDDAYLIMHDEYGAYVRKETEIYPNRQFVFICVDKIRKSVNRDEYELILTHEIAHQMLHAMFDTDITLHKYVETCTNHFYHNLCPRSFHDAEDILVILLALIFFQYDESERNVVLSFLEKHQSLYNYIEKEYIGGKQRILIDSLNWAIHKQDCRELQDEIPDNEDDECSKQDDIDRLRDLDYCFSDRGIEYLTVERLCKLMNITTMSLPAGEHLIMREMMEGFCSVEHIVIPEGVTTIREGAFRNCASLRELRFPSSIQKIESGAFTGCSAIEHISIQGDSNNVYECKNDCIIEKATGLLVLGCKYSVIPEGVTEIGEWAFCDCRGLTSIAFPESLQVIGKRAFYGCTGLTHLVIPATIKTLKFAAFSACHGLRTVVFHGPTTLGYQSFAHCISLAIARGESDEPMMVDHKAFLHTYYRLEIDFPGGIVYGEKIGVFD